MSIELVQSKTGNFTSGTTGSATLDVGTTVGNTVLIIAYGWGGGNFTTVPSGFTKISPTISSTLKMATYRKAAVAGETSWTLTLSTAIPVAWVVYELSGVDLTADPVDASSAWTQATSTTCSTGATATTTAYDAVALAMHGGGLSAGSPIPTFSAQTDGFTELDEQGSASASLCVGMAVSWKALQSLAAVSTSATVSASVANGGWVVVLAAAGSKRDANITVMAGFEWGTTAGLATGNAGNQIFGLVTGAPAIVTSTPRTGTYCLECSASAAAEYLTWDTSHFGTSKPVGVLRLCVRFPSSLPGGDVELARIAPGNQPLSLWFRSATGKLGLVAGSGTEQADADTVAADTWYGIDIRYTTTTGAGTYAADWQVDGVDQTQATVSGAGTSGLVTVNVGFVTAATATVRYDDIAVSVISGNYPLGDLRLHPLTVDTGATLTLSGTAANWKTYTANGTLAAWDATVARGAIDEVPPTIGASADGIAQVTAAAAEYVEVPLTTRQAVPDEAIRSVRVYVPGWSPSATAQSFRVDGYDGTAATTLHAVADPNFDNSTSSPAWIAKMWKPSTGWTQAKLDAAAVRLGFSNAAQDVGWHAVIAEVAVQPVSTGALFGDLATANTDQVSAGLQSVNVTPSPGYDAILHTEEGGTPTDTPIPGGTTTQVTLEAPDEPSVEYVALYPPPEDTPDA